MEKVFKVISNSLLTVFLFALMMLPIASMTIMGLKPQDTNVLSAQDKATVEKVKESTESTDTELTEPNLLNPEQINY